VECSVRVVQIPGGEIIDASIVSPCNADDATRRSITAAVMRVGNLPYRGYEDVFERQITFVFVYDG
jgi:colicin import membrane protein